MAMERTMTNYLERTVFLERFGWKLVDKDIAQKYELTDKVIVDGKEQPRYSTETNNTYYLIRDTEAVWYQDMLTLESKYNSDSITQDIIFSLADKIMNGASLSEAVIDIESSYKKGINDSQDVFSSGQDKLSVEGNRVIKRNKIIFLVLSILITIVFAYIIISLCINYGKNCFVYPLGEIGKVNFSLIIAYFALYLVLFLPSLFFCLKYNLHQDKCLNDYIKKNMEVYKNDENITITNAEAKLSQLNNMFDIESLK